MTVAIGLVCKDGVLVASDSMGSNADIAQDSVKVHCFNHNPVVWTTSGSVYVAEEIEMVVRDKIDTAKLDIFTKINPDAVRKRMTEFVHPAMNKAYKSALGVVTAPQNGGTYVAFPTSFMFLGWGDKGWFLEYDASGEINDHMQHRFYAIGSGGPFAHVCLGLMQHLSDPDTTLSQGMLIAYRAIKTTCQVSSGKVGGAVQMAVADGSGARVLDVDELGEIETLVERWKVIERDMLLTTASSAASKAVGDLPPPADALNAGGEPSSPGNKP